MFVHQPTKSLILKSRDPERIIKTLGAANARPLSSPHGNVVVRHNVDVVRILRNMGVKAPSPIWDHYGWPGKYTPFDHQRVMADVMTVHPRCFNLSEMGCVSGDTEYLTPTGWKRIDAYDGGMVAQYDPETRAIQFVDAEYVKLPCEQMIRFQTTKGVDQLLSPEHRVLLADGRVVTAEEVYQRYGHQDEFNRTLKFRTTFATSWLSGMALTDAQIRVQIAANADGWFQANRVYVRLKRARKIERLRQLLIDAGIEFWEKPCLPEGFVKFAFKPPMPKGFGPDWWACNQPQLEVIADEVRHWDGSQAKRARGPRFTGTKQDADFVQYVWSAMGLRATLTQDARSPDVWNVSSTDRTEPGLLGRTVTNVANNVRLEPSPDGFKYCFMVPSTFLILRRNGCIFATGNTGKTYAALWAADYLMSIGAVKRCVILTPLSTMHSVWLQDTFKILMHRRAVVVHGSRERREKALNMDVDFYIINHHGIAIDQVATALRKRKDIDLIILDEASVFRNHQTNMYRFLQWVLSKQAKRFWCMTGTPTPMEPADAWAICRLIAPKNVPEHKGEFFRKTMEQITPFKAVPKRGYETIVFDAMQPAVRFKKKDCLDLPPMTILSRDTSMSKEQKQAFEEMKEEMVADVRNGVTITAVHAADKINKLRQILCGVVHDKETGTYQMLDNTPRLNDLVDAIHEAQAKVLIIVPFKGIINRLHAQLAHKNINMGVLNGDVSVAQRRTIIHDFKNKPKSEMHGLLCHPKVMAHGLNLTEADMLIFYAPIYSYDEYAQVIERMNRTGQTLKMTVLRMAAHPMEKSIYRTLDDRGMQQNTILDLYGEVTERKGE